MSEHGHRNRLVDATFALLAILCGNRKFGPCVALSGQNCKPSTIEPNTEHESARERRGLLLVANIVRHPHSPSATSSRATTA